MDPLLDTFTPGEEIRFDLRAVLCDRRSPYQHIRIVETGNYGRALILDGTMQSCARDEAFYHEALVHPAMALCPRPPRQVLILGGGEGATLREVLRHGSVEQAIMVDIDAQVVAACREFLPSMHAGAFDDPRARVVNDDAEAWLRDHDDLYDVIVFDIVDPSEQGPASHLFDAPLFELLRRRLAPNGLLAMQYGAAFDPHLESATRVIGTVAGVFRHVALARTFVPSFHGCWGIALAAERADSLDLGRLRERLAERVAGELSAFDGASLTALFSLPVAVRRQILGR